MRLKTQSNERRCTSMVEQHLLELPQCCPVSGNPGPGSTIEIEYRPTELLLEVASLRRYIDSYAGGRGGIRSMEGMIQAVTQDCADALRVRVRVVASLVIEPRQKMHLDCTATPTRLTA